MAALRHRSFVAGLLVGAATAVIVAVVVDLTFIVVDNVWLDIVSHQVDKIAAFQQSGMHSMRDYINSTFWIGTTTIFPLAGVMGLAAGALGAALEGLVRRRPPRPSTPRSAPADGPV